MSELHDDTLATLMGKVARDITGIIHAEVALALQQLKQAATGFALGAAFFVVALFSGLIFVVALVGVSVTGFGDLFHSAFWGWVVTAAILLVLGVAGSAGVGYLVISRTARLVKEGVGYMTIPFDHVGGDE